VIGAERTLRDVDRLDEYGLRVAIAPVVLQQVAELDECAGQAPRDPARPRYSTAQTRNLPTTVALVHQIRGCPIEA